MNAASRESLYTTLARASGLLLVVVCVLFQRRGLIDWSELVFLGLCIGMQETFLRLNVLRRLRTPMLVFYSMMPLMLVLYHGTEISKLQGDFVQIVLYTPLPLVLISVQIMVLYVREASRLVSVVLVLALFSTVIGVRRPMDDAIWPWLAGIGAAASLFLMLQHPGMLFHGVYLNRRRGSLPPSGRPGGIVRGAFFSVLPLFTMMVLVASLFLYFAIPRLQARSDGQGGYEIGIDPGTTDADNNPVTPDRNNPPRNNPNNPPDTTGPATVSGLAQGVDLGDFGEIKRSQTPALNVQLVSPPRVSVKQVYLRAFTYAIFDGQRWEPIDGAERGNNEVVEAATRRLPNAPAKRGSDWDQRRYSIELKDAGLGSGGVLPLPTEAQSLTNLGGPMYYHPGENTLRAPQAKPGDSYEVLVHQLTASGDQMKSRLKGRGPANAPDPGYLQVPYELRVQIERRFKRFYGRFSKEVLSRDEGVYAAAIDIVRMFREARLEGTDTPAWSYSLDFRPEPGTDAIARFLDTETSRPERFGHCEYFASAMCILMRCYGVPARVAAGFLATKPNDAGVFEVTAASAHAWVEVYFDNYGWLAFDPTPPESTEAGGVDPTVEDPKPPTPEEDADAGEGDEVAAAADDWLKDYDGRAQQEVFRNIAAWTKSAIATVDEALTSVTDWLPETIFPRSGILRTLCLVLPPGVVAFVLLYRRRRRKKIEAKVLQQMGEGGRKRERGLYFQLLLLLARYGYQKRASETPREFAQRVMRKGGKLHSPIVELTEIYYALRFGSAGELEDEFKHELAEYGDSLRAQQNELRSGSSGGGPDPQPA